MIKKLLSIIILFLVLLNIPGITLEVFSIGVSSPISYLMFFFLMLSSFLLGRKYPKPIYFVFAFISSYFLLSQLNYYGSSTKVIIVYTKSILYLFGLYSCLKYSSEKTILILLLLGGVTIILDSFFFRFNDVVTAYYTSFYGRYSGFYLNPNTAAFISILGYCIVLVKKHIYRLLLIFFTLFGILTLSRTFIISWMLINFIYLFYNKKHLIKSGIVFFVGLSIFINFSGALKLDENRFGFFTQVLAGNFNPQFLGGDSRQETWERYYDSIYNAPLLGNGYGYFGEGLRIFEGQGVHNSFLLILGESGVVPFLLCICLFIWFFIKSYSVREIDLLPLFLTLILSIQFLVSHNFFDSGLMIFVAVFIIHLISKTSAIKNKINTKT